VNDEQRGRMVKKIDGALGGLAGKILAVLGLTFKPETDDMRDAPALAILPVLLEQGAGIRAHDPMGMEATKELLPEGVVYCADIYETFEGADAVVLMTEWNAYRGLDMKRVLAMMRGRTFVDLRNVYVPGEMEAAGFAYVSVGRGGKVGRVSS